MKKDRLEVNLWHEGFTKKFKERKVGDTRYFVAECSKLYTIEAIVKKSNSADPLDNYLMAVFKIDGTQVHYQMIYPASFHMQHCQDKKIIMCHVTKVSAVVRGSTNYNFKFQPTEQTVTDNNLGSLHLGTIEVALYKGKFPIVTQDPTKTVGTSGSDKKFWLQPSAFTAFVAQPNYNSLLYDQIGPPHLVLRCPYHTKNILGLIANEHRPLAPAAVPPVAPVTRAIHQTVAPTVATVKPEGSKKVQTAAQLEMKRTVAAVPVPKSSTNVVAPGAPAPTPDIAAEGRPKRAAAVRAKFVVEDSDSDYQEESDYDDDDDEEPVEAEQEEDVDDNDTVDIPIKEQVTQPLSDKAIKVVPSLKKEVASAKSETKPVVKRESVAAAKVKVKPEKVELCDITNTPKRFRGAAKKAPETVDLCSP